MDALGNPRILLGLLESVERNGGQTQRRLAAELGIALGLVNLYIKRCAKKGLLKVREAPAGRYAYYLTPRGFAAKSRLTVEYLSYSFSFFRQAKADCSAVFQIAASRGYSSVVLAGRSDLAEIAALCAIENGIMIVAVVDERVSEATVAGMPKVASFAEVQDRFDAVVVTDLVNPAATARLAIRRFGPDRVLIPELFRIRTGDEQGETA